MLEICISCGLISRDPSPRRSLSVAKGHYIYLVSYLRTHEWMQPYQLTSDSADAVIDRLEEMSPHHSLQVQKAFPITSPFQDTNYRAFAEALLSNLLGGMGFFHGDQKVSQIAADDAWDIEHLVSSGKAMVDTKIIQTKASSLLSFTPSRSSSPRGLLWNEGFHLLPVLEWDIDLAIFVLNSWLGQMDKDGWIAREQILGAEARSKVQEQFQVQYPHHASPPPFVALVLPSILAKLTSKVPYNGHKSKYISTESERIALLKKLYPALSQYYMHFRRTQAGIFNNDTYPRPPATIDGEGFRWRGRTAHHTIPSGLDDYPRAQIPSPGELHVDALAWVGASAKGLLELAEYLSIQDEASVFRDHLHDAQHNLDVLHWSEQEGVYCDATVDTNGKYAHVCHKGYVSIMPLLLGLMNSTHPRLPDLLTSLADPATLWSAHGLRSLSAQSDLYSRGDNHWRGAVWMNLNTLAVLRLHEIGIENPKGEATSSSSRALHLAEELRAKVVGTVYSSWMTTGHVWEQYGDRNGEGRGSQGFTGWTAVVLLLLGLEFGTTSQANSDGVGGVGQSNLDSGVAAEDALMGGMAGQMASTKTVVLWAAVALLVMVLRRRLLRFTGRMAGAWRARGTRGSEVGRVEHGGKYEQGIALDGRTD